MIINHNGGNRPQSPRSNTSRITQQISLDSRQNSTTSQPSISSQPSSQPTRTSQPTSPPLATMDAQQTSLVSLSNYTHLGGQVSKGNHIANGSPTPLVASAGILQRLSWRLAELASAWMLQRLQPVIAPVGQCMDVIAPVIGSSWPVQRYYSACHGAQVASAGILQRLSWRPGGQCRDIIAVITHDHCVQLRIYFDGRCQQDIRIEESILIEGYHLSREDANVKFPMVFRGHLNQRIPITPINIVLPSGWAIVMD